MILEGKEAYRYARWSLGFWTYWRCRIVDAAKNKRTWWRVLDSSLTAVMVGTAYMWGTWWLAVGVLVYGLWNYTDGMARTRW